MKKIVATLMMVISIFSCSTLNITPDIPIPNSFVKASLAKKVEKELNLYVAKINVKVKDVFVEENKLQILLEAEASNVLNSFLGVKPYYVSAQLETDLNYKNGKIHTKDISLRHIKGLDDKDKEIVKAITNALMYVVVDGMEVVDLKEKNINPNFVKNVYVGEKTIVVELQ